MSDYNYDTYCGLYCGACSIMKAHQSGVKDPFACFFGDEAGMDLKCRGCKSDQVFENCARCPIRPCAREKGVEHCFDCPDYPCRNFGFYQFLLEKLPHLKTIAVNVQTIQSQGVSRWLEEQESQWKCPDCQTAITWYATHCANCGKDLVDFKPYKITFDKNAFQIITPPDPDEMFKKESVFKVAGMNLVTVQKDIVYTGESGSELLCDLYFPPDTLPDNKLPLVVLVHGDAPVTGLKNSGQYTSLGKIIAASGLTAAAFNHRTLMQGAKIGDVIGDIENVLAFLIENGDQYGIDQNRIAIWSLSAGVPFGLYAGIHNSPAYIKCMAAYYGFGDFSSLCRLFNIPLNPDEANALDEKYSPVKLLNQNSDKIAPILVARAGMDQFPFLLDSLDHFVKEALSNNIPVDVYNHPTGVHAFDLINDEPRTHEIIEKTLDFLKKHLGSE